MRISRTPFLLLAVLLAFPSPGSAQADTPRCATPEHRQFDFWIGEWVVHVPDGRRAGHNTITREMDGCVLHESYHTDRGYRGESFNAYDAGRGVWHQTWVDNAGLVLRLDGGSKDGSMILSGETVGTDGSVSLQRITWSVLDGDPDRVRQLWETSTDGGETWEVAFDGEYRRVEG